MTTHTPIPTKFRGEADLARHLDAMPASKCHFWFGLDFLPGVKDIDILLLHEEIGVFAVEVKAVPLSDVIQFGFDHCEIRGRGRQKSPQLQAYDAAVDLRNYLSGSLELPFMVATACWPLITRRSWNDSMSNEKVRGEFAGRMLFREDLYSGVSNFRSRLKYIYDNPPIRSAAKYHFRFSSTVLTGLREELRVEARPQVTPTDLSRLQEIERSIENETDRQTPTSEQRLLLYSGLPGTGKTFRLLRIAYRHAMAGKKVLLVCFNKVLATDLRRLLSLSKELRDAVGEIEVRDVFQIVSSYAAGLGVRYDSADADDWGEMVSLEMLKSERASLYETLLIDEGQDMRQWHYNMLEYLAKPEATIVVAFGRGQELYGESAPWLETFRSKAREYQLRRNFRNTRPVFRLAQTLFEAGYDLQKIDRFAERFRRAEDQDQLQFLREDGEYPELRYFDDRRLRNLRAGRVGSGDEQHKVMVTEYERILRQELETLRKEEWPVDLLILVPNQFGLEREWAADAIRRMSEDYDFLDYTDTKQRRVPARPHSLRLCTFHSARGIEGTRVVIFGIEQLRDVADATKVGYKKLAYITLSRSIAECIIALPSSSSTHESAIALDRALAALGVPTVSSGLEIQSTAVLTEKWNQTSATHNLRYGDVVRHPTYGNGIVVHQKGEGPSSIIVADFDVGTKSVPIEGSGLEAQS